MGVLKTKWQLTGTTGHGEKLCGWGLGIYTLIKRLKECVGGGGGESCQSCLTGHTDDHLLISYLATSRQRSCSLLGLKCKP